MAEIIEAIVTKSEPDKGAYAITRKTNENVYIPIKVADAAGLAAFDEVKLIVVENDRPEPPWRAITAKRLTED